MPFPCKLYACPSRNNEQCAPPECLPLFGWLCRGGKHSTRIAYNDARRFSSTACSTAVHPFTRYLFSYTIRHLHNGQVVSTRNHRAPLELPIKSFGLPGLPTIPTMFYTQKYPTWCMPSYFHVLVSSLEDLYRTSCRSGSIRRAAVEKEPSISYENFVTDLETGDSFTASLVDILVKVSYTPPWLIIVLIWLGHLGTS